MRGWLLMSAVWLGLLLAAASLAAAAPLEEGQGLKRAVTPTGGGPGPAPGGAGGGGTAPAGEFG